MGYALFAGLVIVIVAVMFKIVLIAVIGTVGVYVGTVFFTGALIVGMVQQTKKGERARGIAMLVSGLSILIPLVVAVFSAPDIPDVFFVADALFGSGLSLSQFNEISAAIILLSMIAWVVGGGYLVLQAYERIEDESREANIETLQGLSLFIIAWGLTAAPVIGWIFGGISNMALEAI